MTLQQIRYFMAVAEAESLTAAAEGLQLAPASVSTQIRRLERFLGVTLFDRTGRALALTSTGQDFLPHARRILQSVQDAQTTASEGRALAQGTLSVGLFRNADYYLLGDVVQSFHSEHPGISLRLLGQNSAEVVHLVASGRVDVGIVVLPVDDSNLSVSPLMRDEVLFATASPGDSEPVSDDRLVGRPLVLYDAHYGLNDPTRRQLVYRLQQRGLRIRCVVEVERVEGAMDLVRRGVGDSIAAGVLFAQGPAVGLTAIRLNEPLYDVVAIVTRKGTPLPVAASAFLDHVRVAATKLAREIDTVSLV